MKASFSSLIFRINLFSPTVFFYQQTLDPSIFEFTILLLKKTARLSQQPILVFLPYLSWPSIVLDCKSFNFRYNVRSCFGGHLENLICIYDESVLFDHIVLIKEEMKYFDAEEYCRNEMNGQIWGDVDAPYEYLEVKHCDF